MFQETQINLFDLVISLSNAIDLVSPLLVGHQKRVALIASNIGKELGFSVEEQEELILAGLLHDCGALSLRERLDLMSFESENPHWHAELGYLLLKYFHPFYNIASLIRYHHVPWDKGKGEKFRGKRVPKGSHILHLADRVEVLINKEEEILDQVDRIIKIIKTNSGKIFNPEQVEAFLSLASKEYFWLSIISPSTDLSNRAIRKIILDIDELINLAKVFSYIIDFRSRFTAIHSSGVAATAEALAKVAGFSEKECKMMKIAGYLHDLGKLAVSTEILEKPAKLTEKEFNIIRSHTFHTYCLLKPIKSFETINTWASLHHEKLDGTGYPFHLKDKDLPLGSKIMAVADIFTALTEDRPYRKGMSIDQALQVLQEMAKNQKLDFYVVSLLECHLKDINSSRLSAQEASIKEYQKLFSNK
jgi:HD-GYP domain-containing protein (c-di-GMP phosphodiesterase class II)